MAPSRITIEPCLLPAQIGMMPCAGGATLAVHARHAEAIEICLFSRDGQRQTARHRLPARTGDIHHGFLAGAAPGLRYGLRAHGPFDPARGHRFDPAKLLADPYAREIDRPFAWVQALADHGTETASLVPKCIFRPPVGPEGPALLAREPEPTLIYELAVGAFTRLLPGAGRRAGTLSALTMPRVIAHLRRLGVSHVELLPLSAWIDERHLPPLGLRNAWGYNPVCFMAPDPRLAPGGLGDLATAVARLREAGIGVILDMVFNHTGESDTHGPTLSLRGLDNAGYFRHGRDRPDVLVNDTGCGNTLALDRPHALRLVMDTLRQFRRLGVAGFRFDLAPVLGRLEHGFSPEAPLLSAIRQDPELAGCLLIAEPWDLGPGGYRLGDFPEPFREWNDSFRSDLRRFWRGDPGMAGALATRLAGSADLFAAARRGPRASINYIACHDGFTLADLVAYEHRRNEANGEGNRDGTRENHSWNCGVEGPTDDPGVLSRRAGDIRALLGTLFFARGIPMLLAGDEAGRSQAGNNNAYAQSGDAFAFDWTGLDSRPGGGSGGQLVNYVAELVRLRRRHSEFAAADFLTGRPLAAGQHPDVAWLTVAGERVRDEQWPELDQVVMLLATGEGHRSALCVNRAHQAVSLALPAGKASWRRLFASGPVGDGMAAECPSTEPLPAESLPAQTLPARSVSLWSDAPAGWEQDDQ